MKKDRILAFVVMVCMLTGVVQLPAFLPVLADVSENVIDYVDTRLGTGGPGNAFVGPQMPWGGIQPGPDTRNGSTDGYGRGEAIRGFSQTHVSGTGGDSRYGNFLISPQTGAINISETGHDSKVQNEDAQVGYYAVTLQEWGIRAELTSAENAAIYRFTFPAGSEPHLLFDLSHAIPRDIQNATSAVGVWASDVKLDPENNQISGWTRYQGGWGYGKEYTMYFSAEVSESPSGFGIWRNEVISENTQRGSIRDVATINHNNPVERLGGYFDFANAPADQEKEIYVKIAVSTNSVENADAFLTEQIPQWDFETVKEENRQAWNDLLSTVKVEDADATEDQLTIFYTNLYHSFLMPHDRTGDSQWDLEQNWDDQYTGWDTHRTVFPLLNLVKQSVVSDNINSFIERFYQNGVKNYVSDAYVAGHNASVQGGDGVVPIITEAFLKGAEGVEWAQAYDLLKYLAENGRSPLYINKGYASNDKLHMTTGAVLSQGVQDANYSASKTMEFSFNDYLTALFAKAIGKTDDYNTYLERSNNWKNLWDDTVADETNPEYTGFIQAKTSTGAFEAIPTTKRDSSFLYEGTPWTYSFDVPFNVPALIEKMGGKDAFIKRLQHFFDAGMIDWGNEPSFPIAWYFNYAGRPDLTASYVKMGMEGFGRDSLPGNDDSGAMGAWYVFSALGFFPIAGTDLYLINGPTFEKVTITMENGKTIEINGKNASPENIYVQSATLNGQPFDRSYFRHSEIKDGAVFEFEMGAEPSDWATTSEVPAFDDLADHEGVTVGEVPVTAIEDESLIMHLPMDETDGRSGPRTVTDVSGHNIHGTANGINWLQTDGKRGGAMYSTGNMYNGMIVNVPGEEIASRTKNAQTTALWFRTKSKMNQAGQQMYIVRHDKHFSFYVTVDAGKGGMVGNARIWTENNGGLTFTFPWNYSDDTYHHFAAVYDKDKPDGENFRVYIDGDLVQVWNGTKKAFTEQSLITNTTQGPLMSNPEKDFRLAVDDSVNNRFTGYIDDVRVYNRALDAAEVQDLAVMFNFDDLPSAAYLHPLLEDGGNYATAAAAMSSETFFGTEGKSLKFYDRTHAQDSLKIVEPFVNTTLAPDSPQVYDANMQVYTSDTAGGEVVPFIEYKEEATGEVTRVYGTGKQIAGNTWTALSFPVSLTASPYAIGVTQPAGAAVLKEIYLDNVTFLKSSFDIQMAAINSRGVEIPSVLGLQEFGVKARLQQNILERYQSVQLIFAVYNADKTLDYVAVSDVIVPDASSVPGTEISISLEQPVDDTQTVKAFLIDTQTLYPLTRPLKLQ